MAIYLLDEHTAELIAAGEVVERPASVVKELCENAIDAQARAITVEIERGGIQLIRISDDGTGIEAGDVSLAFVRHATSKVRTEKDLEAIRTLGFRGEALASIASVAKVELLTKNDGDENASVYHIEGGREGEVTPAARPRGTTITVRDIFYNTPARMKFLKKDASEGGYVTETVTHLALSHPQVAFRYLRDGKQVFATPGDGDLRSAAYSVLGAEFARELVEVDDGDGKSSVSGLITPPRAGRASRSMQFFFINGRYVKNRTMMAGLEQAYRSVMMHGKYPGALLFVQMPPELVDVNVHPAKTEVRFAKDQEVFTLVYRAVKSALADATAAHSHFFTGPEEAAAVDNAAGPAPEREETPDAPQNPLGATGGKIGVREVPAPAGAVKNYNDMVASTAERAGELASSAQYVPYETTGPGPYLQSKPPAAGAPAAMAGFVAVGEGPMHGHGTGYPAPGAGSVKTLDVEGPQEEPQQQTLALPDEMPLRLVGEVFKTYIITERDEVLYLIDKHAAHERILYEQLAAARGTVDAQQLLAPQNVLLAAAEKNALLQNTEALMEAGIEVEDFGGNAVLVRSVPADVAVPDVEALVIEVAGRLAANEKDTIDEKTEWVLHSIACRAAVKAGDKTEAAQMMKLADDIIGGVVPPFCPHGRPVVLEITRKELEKQFGRLG